MSLKENFGKLLNSISRKNRIPSKQEFIDGIDKLSVKEISLEENEKSFIRFFLEDYADGKDKHARRFAFAPTMENFFFEIGRDADGYIYSAYFSIYDKKRRVCDYNVSIKSKRNYSHWTGIDFEKLFKMEFCGMTKETDGIYREISQRAEEENL